MPFLLHLLSGSEHGLVHSASVTVPNFSDTYTVKGTLYIPYAEVKEPFYAYYDLDSGNSRIDYYG
ncbi:unnamed protein product, partial [Timema podura]|nr:unnamed protein product [Timema podura]